MDTENRHVGGDQGFPHDGREDGCVVADVNFSVRNVAPTHYGGDTLQYGILAPHEFPFGGRWVVTRGQRSHPPQTRHNVTHENRR